MSLNKATIMIVDDTVQNLRLLENILWERDYRVLAIPNGEMAIKVVKKSKPDLIMLDINMPNMNGFEVCNIVKADNELKDIPIMFISALNDTNDKVKAFSCGGIDYITKPFQYEEVLARVETHLSLAKMKNELEENNKNLQKLVNEQVKKITNAQFATIFALAKLAESRDCDTGKHLEKVQKFCLLLARELSGYSTYSQMINENFILNIKFASALHDVGKVSIPDSILLKPGKLTFEEFEIIKTHTTVGANMLQTVLEKYPENSFVQLGIDVALYHHERWDGSGYPRGLKGEEVPLAARIMSVADVYDALRSKRPYKEPFPHKETVQNILDGRGTQFDPVVVDMFIKLENSFEEIYKNA